MENQRKTVRIGIITTRSFRLTSLCLVLDALEMASSISSQDGGTEFQWELINSSANSIQSSCGARALPTSFAHNLGHFDYMFLIGGMPADESHVHPRLQKLIRQVAASEGTVIGVGGGSDLLVKLGLMRGKRFCVSWLDQQSNEAIEYEDVELVEDQLFVVDGEIVTCVGGIASLDVALWLIRQHCDFMVVDMIWRRLMGQKPRQATERQPKPSIVPTSVTGTPMEVLRTMEQSLEHPLQLSELAEKFDVSTKTLTRMLVRAIGMTPKEAYMRIRLIHAARALMDTEDSITEISAKFGFSDSAHFSRTFSKEFGRSPSAARHDASGTLLNLTLISRHGNT